MNGRLETGRFLNQILAAVGVSALAACGAEVVFVTQGEGGGGTDAVGGTTGDGGTTTDGGAGGISFGGQTNAGGETSTGCDSVPPNVVQVCVAAQNGTCMSPSTPELLGVLGSRVAEIEQNNSICQQGCGCWPTFSFVDCLTQPSPSECCYGVVYTLEEQPCAGRPYSVGSHALTASRVASTAWSTELSLEALQNHPDVAIVREAWAARASFEHASIASFARFMLDLMTMGAPMHLVRDAERAMRDEIDHAEACYSVARALGLSVGPGLFERGSEPTRTRELIVNSAIVEGCIGETQAALVARRTAEKTTHPVLRETLMKIADDELRHAELAWAFVAWAHQDETLRPTIAQAFATMGTAQAEGLDCAEETLRTFGFLSAEEERAVLDEARRGVIAPAKAALLQGDAKPGSVRDRAIDDYSRSC